MNNWLDFSLEKTLRDYDFTGRAVHGMQRIINAEDFADMDAKKIFAYLSNEMEIVLFPDFLKRYLYEKSGIEAPFSQVTDDTYMDILQASFEANRAPHSFHASSRRQRAAFRDWLTKESVRRSTVFLLGFGLRMPPEDVSRFLTKVLKEADFDFRDPQELIFWYCYRNGSSYASAVQLLEMYEEIGIRELPGKQWEAWQAHPEAFLMDRQNFAAYLSALKAKRMEDNRKQRHFQELLDRCLTMISEIYGEELMHMEDAGIRREKKVGISDLEHILYSGIPLDSNGNMQKLTASRFHSLFREKRLTRQRISSILKGKSSVDRYDLLTLLFFLHASAAEPDWPTDRYLQFVEKANELLEDCDMYGIYPVNPYESFLLMCMITEYPLAVFAEVWERSFEDGCCE